ncbi:aromatic-ring-hydroxylating dioxygenase subunit beta [Janibacter limosus]|uniref:aromatic-ring-hydroxylating dioxygenase subunit beta n=1 Tax=Janibacter limosus TaxID=53458 RepID=UPI000834A421|nr:3-phenylpropionate/cinnamic acid dioxygenase subunit beta [Janibacter limosus]
MTNRPLSSTSPEHTAAVDFLMLEAELLDDLEERRWLVEMVSRDVIYQLPLRQTVERSRGNGVAPGMYHLNEDYGSLGSKVKRNETAYAWAEDPPSRVRHFVTNVRVRHGERPGELAVRSNILIYRTRQDQTTPQLLAGERHDVLRDEGEGLRLLRRSVVLDLTVIGTHNLSIFF